MAHMNKQHVSAIALAALAGMLLMLGPSVINAATVGYWRFESSADFLEDSGPNDYDLSTGGTTVPTFLALPVSGAGSKFDNPIPQTGQSNAGVANFGTTQDGYLYAAGNSGQFDVTDFTIEAYINRDSDLGDQMIASQSGGTDRSWQFSVNASDLLTLYLTEDGNHSSFQSFSAGFGTMSTDTDYYVAASFDLSEQTGGVKFYRQNLTAGTAMETSVLNHTRTALHNSDLNFVIGSRDPTQYEWTGLIDEVRFSNTVLSYDQLLATTPEPSALVVWGIGILGFLLLRRRRRRQA